MSAYTISYEADTLPSDLPAGAKVERKSVLPLEFSTTYSGRTVRVNKRSFSDGADITVNGGQASALDKDEVARVITALQEATGTLPPVEVAQDPGKFPKVITTNLNRKFTVSQGGSYDGGAHLKVENTEAWSGGTTVQSALNKDNARELAHALLAAIGEPVTKNVGPKVGDVIEEDGDMPSNSVKAVRGYDGDVYYRVKDNPGSRHNNAWRRNSREGMASWSWDDISD